MSFLAPLFLLGGLSIALPIIFHLIRRSAKERVPFSSLMFLLPSPPRLTRRSRLEDLLLLLARCLVILLIALGFARPYLNKALPVNPQAAPGRRVVLMVDTSASMKRPDLWDDARKRAFEFIDKVTPLDEIAFATFDRAFQLRASFEQLAALPFEERIASLRNQINQSQPGWNETQLGTALIAAARTIDEFPHGSDAANLREKQIVAITDLQDGSHIETMQGFQWPRGLTVRAEVVGKKVPGNAGVQWVIDPDDLGGPVAKFSPRLRVTNSRDATREKFQVSWSDSPQARPVEIYVPPGQNRTVALESPAGGTAASRAVLGGDEVLFDNQVFVAPPDPRQVEVWFIGAQKPPDPAEPLFYLRQAFMDTRRQKVTLTNLPPNAARSSAEPGNAKLVVADETLGAPWMSTLREMVTAGKTLLIVLKSVATGETLRQLLQLPDLTLTEKAGSYVMLKDIDFEHPLFAPLADSRFRDFTKIHFWKHRALAAEKIPNSRVLARFDDEDPALVEVSLGKGKVLILTSGWQPADSQFALSSKFVPFCFALLDSTAEAGLERFQYFIGERIILPNVAGSIRKPDGSEQPLPAGESFAPEAPGIYRWSGNGRQFAFAINLKPAESQTAALSMVDLERMGVPVAQPTLRKPAPLSAGLDRGAATLERQQKIWRWLLLAAIVVLFGETLAAAWVTRHRLPTANPEIST